LIGVAVGVALLVACTSGILVVANRDRLTAGEPAAPTPGGGQATEWQGWEDCAADPNACNSGEVVPGGELVWAAQSGYDWNLHGSVGSTVTLAQIMAGVAPSTGVFLPDGTWQWNLDLLAAEPTLTGDQPQTWVYEIGPEARWSDGTDITADDFSYLWKHNANDPELCVDCFPASSLGYERIESVVGSNGGKTVTVTMREGEPDPEWWTRFTHLYPAHLATAEGFDLDTPEGMKEASTWFAEAVPDWSGGPWQIAAGDLSSEVILEPNPQWYGAVNPSLDRLTFRLIDDPDVVLTALMNGEIDGAGPRLDPGPRAVTAPDVLVHVGSGEAWDHIDLNLARPGLDDVALRRAIFTAIDIEAVIQQSYGELGLDLEPKLNHLLPPGSPYYQDHLSATGQGTGDVDAARDILDQAGYQLQDGVLAKDGEPVGPLVFQYSEGNQRRGLTGEVVSAQLAEIGIEVEVQAVPLIDILEERAYDIIIFGWSGTAAFAHDGQQFWHSESRSNFGSYTNDEVDALVTDASYASDQESAAALLNEAMAIVTDEAYVLPIAYTPQQTIASNQFRNIRPHPTAADLFYNSHEWGLAAG
jgi:peptide/nickel transport system substrate-binding protein